jgi:hypothetical protein
MQGSPPLGRQPYQFSAADLQGVFDNFQMPNMPMGGPQMPMMPNMQMPTMDMGNMLATWLNSPDGTAVCRAVKLCARILEIVSIALATTVIVCALFSLSSWWLLTGTLMALISLAPIDCALFLHRIALIADRPSAHLTMTNPVDQITTQLISQGLSRTLIARHIIEYFGLLRN